MTSQPPVPPGPPGPTTPPLPLPLPKRTEKTVALVVAVVVVLALAVGGFLLLTGGDDDEDDGGAVDSADRVAYVEAIVASGRASDDYPSTLSDAEIRCLAELVVDIAGVERLAAEYTPDEIRADPDWELEDDYTRDEAEVLIDGMGDCVDVRQFLLDGMAEDGSDNPVAMAMAACMPDWSDDDIRLVLLVGALEDGDEEILTLEEAQRMTGVVLDCVDFEAMFLEDFDDGTTAGGILAGCMADALFGQNVMEEYLVTYFMEGEEAGDARFEDGSGAFMDSVVDCPDFRTFMYHFMADDPATGPEAAECILDALSDELLRQFVLMESTGEFDPVVQQEITQAVAHCEALAP